MRFTAPVLFVCLFVGRASEIPAARWEGAVHIPGLEMRLVIDLSRTGNEWTGSAIMPGLGVKGAPLTGIVSKGSDIAFTIKALGDPVLTAHLAADGNSLSGDYKQAGNSAPFTLQRVGPAQVDLPRQSTAVLKEVEGDWQGEMSYFGRTVRVRIHLANQAEGKASGEIVLIGRRETKLPVDIVTQEENTLTLLLLEAQITYEGRFRKEPGELMGTFSQGPFETPLNLKRTNP